LGRCSCAIKGYEEKDTLHRVIDASRKVKNGEVSYERDGTVFHKVEYLWPGLGGLMTAAAFHEGHLRVLDFVGIG
jgi:hypothetical protein